MQQVPAVIPQCSKLQLSSKFLQSVQQGITWLDLDRLESRYLLCAGADASVAVYDTQHGDSHSHSSSTAGSNAFASPHLQPTFVINRTTHPLIAPEYFVSCVAWYPVDSGLFVTGSYDNNVCVWDTNSLERVGNFKLPGRVSCLAMSSLASHCLVAASSLEPADHAIRLCDPASGAFSHTLAGHREEVWAVAWSLQSEFQLLSGDRYGQMRLWDIRRAGCMHPPPPPPPSLPPAATPLSGPELNKRRRTGLLSHSGSSGSDLARLSIFPPDPRQSRRSEARRSDSSGSAGQPDPLTRQGSSPTLCVRPDRPLLLRQDSSPRPLVRQDPSSAPLARQTSSPRLLIRRQGSSPRPDPPRSGLDSNDTGSHGRANGPSNLSDASARAHGGAITCVLPSPDATHVFSAATDSRLKVWDVAQRHTLLVNYPNTFNRAIRARQMCCNEDGAVLFHPSGGVVQVLDAHTGVELSSLSQGHHESINCCVYNPLLQELYTGANDHQILVWQVHGGRENAGSQGAHTAGTGDTKEDNWED
ncbi:MAG: hypothetical protein WDW36_005509 [Sanguina aurantia]